MTTTRTTAADGRSRLALALSGVSKSYDGRRRVLSEIDLEVRSGSVLAVLGKSGGGKSTLLRLLSGLDSVYQGEIAASSERAVVFQEPRLFPFLDVRRNVALGFTPPPGGPALKAAVDSVLADTGLSDKAGSWPADLSGGEQQRVSLARALLRRPGLLLLDEPFSALDAVTKRRLYELVITLFAKYRPTVVLVTHDIDEAFLLADRVIVLAEGRIAVDFPAPHTEEDRDARKRQIIEALGVSSAEEIE